MCDLSIMIYDNDIANYADDNTPFVPGDSSLHVIKPLKNVLEKLFE